MLNTDYDVPFISKQLADYLKEELSADRQITMGLLSDDDVLRSESYLLGFLAGLGYGRQVIDIMVANQDSAAEESGTIFRDIIEDDLSNHNMF